MIWIYHPLNVVALVTFASLFTFKMSNIPIALYNTNNLSRLKENIQN